MTVSREVYRGKGWRRRLDLFLSCEEQVGRKRRKAFF
jgi:hypothetical protein